MKKLLTILILLLTVATQGRATTKVEKILWDNSISEYSSGIELNSETVGTFAAGNVLRVYASVPETGANFKICYKSASNNWAETAIPSIDTQWPWVNGGETYKDFTLTAADITAFSGNNIYIYKGQNSTITKVSLIKGEEITCPDLTNLKIGDEVTVKYNKPEDGSQLIIKVNEVEPYKTNSTDETNTFDTFVVTEEICDNIKEGGLVLECSRNSNNQNSTIIFNEITLVAGSNIMGAYSSSTLEAKSVSMSNVSLQTGYRLKVSKVNKNSNASLVISYTDGSTSTEIYTLENNDTEIEITDANKSNIQSNGLILTGNDLALTKVELIASSHETDYLSSSQFTKLWSTTSGNPASTIEFSSTWGGAGWNIGDDKYNAAQSITVALSAAPTTPLKLVLEYVTTNGAVLTNTSDYGNSTDGFTASSTVSVPQSDLLKIRKLYIQNPYATTTITLSSVKIATSVLNNDNMSVYEVASSVFSSALVGDKIKITYSSISSGDMTLQVGTTDGGTDVLASGTVTGTSKEIEITASTLANIKSNGLYLRGNNITISSNVELVAVPPFTGDDNSKTANLARFVADAEGATYDGNGTITTTAEYKGVKLTLSEGQYVSGTRLIVTFQSATNAKVHVNYAGKTWGEGSENTGDGTQLIVPLNINNEVSEIIIQLINATPSATLTGVSVDNICMLTTTAVNGSITVTKDNVETTATEFAYGTGLTLTATANGHFVFSKWKKNGEDAGTSSPLAITMDGNVSVDALFKATPLNNGEALTVWSGETTGQSWGEELQITSEITDILERFETIKITASRIATSEESPNYKVFLSTLGTTAQIGNFECNGVTDGQVVEFSLSTDALVNLLKEGFGICVQNTKITKVELYKPNIPVALGDEKTREVWSNSTGEALNWGYNEIFISALDAHILEAGEQVIVTSIVNQPESGDPWPKAFLADGSKAVSPTIDGTECRITLTSEIVEKIKDGFYISGGDSKAKKIEFYKPVVIFIDGKANLDRGTESSGSTTLTAPHDEAVTGNVMVVNLTETNPDAKVKVTYSDGSSIEIAPSKRKVGTPTATQVVVPLNMEKYIKSVSVNTAKAKISEIYMTTISAFEADASNFVADLSLAKAMDNTTFDTSSYTIATTVAWSGGIQLDVLEGETVKGKELMIQTESDADLKVTVEYESGDKTEVQDRPASKEMKVVIDGNRAVKQILIQPKTASVTKLLKVAVNASATPDPNVFSKDDKGNFVADLSMVKAEGATYNNTTFTMVATDNWQGVTVTPGNAEVVKGKELYIEFDKAALGYAKISYVDDETSVEGGLDAAGTVMKIALDDSKQISKIEIKLKEAGTAKFKKIAVNAIDASEEAKKLFNVLKNLYGKKIVSGVVANVDWNTKEAENVYNWTGKWPALNVYDFINLHASKDVNSAGWVDYSDITTAKNWWKEGGIVGAMWHWQVKANNGTDYTCTPGTAAGETSFDASKVYVEGTSENTLAKQQLDQLCGYLKKMQDAGIPVVWRPLHEASGNVEQYSGGKAWFWWGAKGADVYKQLWQWMYNYMVNTKGLNNLIWVWTSQTNDNNWYPGDAYVDIIGRDNYGATAATLATEYEALKAAYPNKMITLSECGNSESTEMAKLSSIWDAGSRWSWFMTWYDGAYNDGTSTTHKHAGKTWWDDAMAKDYVVTRDQMKKLLGQDSGGGSQTGVNISLDDLNEGWSSSYNATTKTITTEGEWAARGWYIGDNRYNSKGSVTVKFEAVQFGVTLKMEYTNTNGDSKSVSAGAAAGETEVELDIPTDVKTIEKVYITYQPIGTLKLTSATVNDKVVDNRTERTLVEKSQAISDGDIAINRGLFSNAVAGDEIRIFADGLSESSKLALEPGDYSGAFDGANWTGFTESPFKLKLTATLIATIKEKGLLIRGESFTFKKAVLYTEKELGSEISDEEKKGDEEKDDEETIIDEKTGEADLTQLAAQDDTKTTLTENEDGSITMTTTEPYCAAQIWFNDPEPVAGNVLKVELAESNVNVTVTVKYTDGTESQMSANTMVANARAMTRAVASARAATRGDSDPGTTIEVPLETGKEVQNIEVKNNVAGTITIKKMQVTTINIFTNGVANLSMLKPQSNATYDTSTHTLATTKGWTGATISPVGGENVSGKELLIEFADASKVKVAVKYRTDVEGPSTIMEKAAKAVRLALDNTKNIQEISIQPTEASIVTFKKIAVNSEESDDGTLKPGKTITLWESAAGETLSWNEVAKQDASVGEMLQEYDELLITISGVTEGCDWPKVFIRDASSEQAGNEVLLNDVGSFPYTVRIVLTGEMAQQLQKGFSICGDGVTVTKLQVYRPEAPKEGDIHLADLNYGYNSSYDKGTHTITTTARWAARGWEIGDKRYNDKNLITVKFEPVDFPVTLKMEYTTGLQTAQATSVGVPAGRTELLLEIPNGISKLNRVYIIYENPGSVKLTEASVTYQDKLKLSTAIEAFEAEGVIHDGRYDTDGWYNLRGMRIAEPKTSGIYIHGGKKVVIY